MAPAHPQSRLCPACVLARQCGSFCWSNLTLHPWVQVRDIPAIVFGTIDHRIDTTFFKYAPDWLKVGAASECLCRRAHKQPSPAIFTGHSFPAACSPSHRPWLELGCCFTGPPWPGSAGCGVLLRLSESRIWWLTCCHCSCLAAQGVSCRVLGAAVAHGLCQMYACPCVCWLYLHGCLCAVPNPHLAAGEGAEAGQVWSG